MSERVYNIIDFGACPDTGTSQTSYIQSAVDACARNGGEVIIPSGSFMIEGIRLYSNITLRLKSGARLYGSENCRDYINFHIPTTLAYVNDAEWIEKWHLPSEHYVNALITCADSENISIISEEGSVIDGCDCYDPEGEEGFRGPMGIRFTRCRGVTLEGYTVVRSANWAHQIDGCEDITVRNVTVREGHDGMDFHHCRNVRVSDCVIETGDDCVAGYDIHGMTVENCRFNTSCNSMRIGASNLAVKDCEFRGPGKYPHRVSGRTNTLCAFEYYSHAADPVQTENSGWRIENCAFSGIDRLIHYDFPTDWALQMTVPLKDVEFVNCSFRNITTPSVFRTMGDRTASLRFKNCGFDACVQPFITEP